MAFQPVYALALYQPRTVDPLEATVLTPSSSSVHGDPFLVATAAGLASSSGGTYQPYLGLIKGRRGRLDPLTKNTDVGEMSLQVLDRKAGAPGDNLTRWATWFFGDAAGLSRWMGTKGYVLESLDGGVTFAPFFTGRISDLKLDGSRLLYTVTLRDASEDLQQPVFVGTPSAAVLCSSSAGSTGYAQVLSLLPVGFVRPYGQVQTPGGPVSMQSPPLTGTIASVGDQAINGVTRRLVQVVIDADQAARADCLVTDQLWRCGAKFWNSAAPLIGSSSGAWGWRYVDDTKQVGRVHLASSSGAFGEMTLVEVYYTGPTANPGTERRTPLRLILADLPRLSSGSTDPPGYLKPTSTWKAVAFNAYVASQWSTDVGILINDVHPVQLWQDLLAGAFGYLWDPGQPLPSTALAYGTPMRPVKTSTALFGSSSAGFIGDGTFPTARFVLTAKDTLGPWIVKNILQPYQLGYYVDGSGQVCPVDLRQPTSAPSLALVEADLVEGQTPTWEHSRDSIKTRAQLTYYVDFLNGSPAANVAAGNLVYAPSGFPIAASILNATPVQVNVLGLGSAAGGDQLVTIDGAGYRTMPDEVMGTYPYYTFNPQPRADYLANKLQEMVIALAAPFGGGAQTLSVECRRTANTNAITVGALVSVTVSQVPDPQSHLRGGARVMVCTERTEHGLQVTLKFLDLGYATACAPPSLDAVIPVPGSSASAAACVVTRAASAAGGFLPTEVHYALSTAALVPSSSSNLWQPVRPLVPWSSAATATVTVLGQPAGARLWMRGRTLALSTFAAQLPSSWVLASSNGYADLTPLPAPSALASSSLTAYGATLLWTEGSTALWTEVYLASTYSGGSSSDWQLALPVLAPSSAGRGVLPNLQPLSSYLAGVRHVDRAGGVSAVTSLALSTPSTASALVATALAGGSVILGGSA